MDDRQRTNPSDGLPAAKVGKTSDLQEQEKTALAGDGVQPSSNTENPKLYRRPPKPSAIHRVKKEYTDDYASMGIKFDNPERWQRHSTALRYQECKDVMAENRETIKHLPFDVMLLTPPSTAGLREEVMEKGLDMGRKADVKVLLARRRVRLVEEEQEGPRMWRRRKSTVLKEEKENFEKLLDVGF